MAKSRRTSTLQVLLPPTNTAVYRKEGAGKDNQDDVVMDENAANRSTTNDTAATSTSISTDGRALFAVLETGKQVSELADQVHAGLATGDTASLVSTLNLILLAAGVDASIPSSCFKQKSVEASFVMRELVSRLDERGDPDYPVADKKRTSVLRRAYFAFFKHLGRCIVINGDPVEQVKAKLLSWVLTMSSVGYRPIRVAGTLAGLGLFEGVASGAHDLSRQVDKLNKMKRRRDSHGATVKIATAESLIGWLTEGLLVQRYRDVDASIRSDVLKTLGECIVSVNPDIFLDNAYLRYIGWSLSDREERLRLQTIGLLKQVCAGQRAALTAFTDRFKGRILEMAAKDVSGPVRERSCELIDRMHSAGLLIVDDCVDLVRDLVEGGRGEGLDLHSSLHYTINQVLFGRPSRDMDISSVCRAIAAFTQNFEAVQKLAKCVDVDVDQSRFGHATDAAAPVYIYLSIAHAKQVVLPIEQLLRLTEDSINGDDDRRALFTLLQSHQSYSDQQQLLLETVMNEIVQCRSDASTAAGIKLLGQWRQSELAKTRLEQWIQTAVQSCWEQVQACLEEFQRTRKLADAPLVPLSFLTALQRQSLTPANVKLIVDSMEQLEGLSLIGGQKGRASSKAKHAAKELLFGVCHRLLLLLYNDLLWTHHHGTSTGEQPADRLGTVKQAASLHRPIVKQDVGLQKAAIAVLTDVALLSRSRDDIDDIVGGIVALPSDLNEWKAVIVGRLFMAGLVQEHLAVPLLCSYREASQTSAEICRAVVERSKSSPPGVIVRCLEGLLSVHVDHLKYAIGHYRAVLKGCGNGIAAEVEAIHAKIVSDKDLDASGALLGFLLDELDTVARLSHPPAIFKHYRRVLDRAAKRKAQPARAVPTDHALDSTGHVFDSTDHVLDSTGHVLDSTDHAFDSTSLSMHDIHMTSPGMDEDGAPSLPNSPLDKIIRLE